MSKQRKRGRPSISADKRRQMRKKIASSTQHLFQTEGYRQISMRRIASEVGCSPMTLYKYYDAKIDILHTLWADVFNTVFDDLDTIHISQASARERLTLLATAYVDYWLNHTEHYRLVFMAEGVTQPDVSLFIESPDISARYEVFAVAIMQAISSEISQDLLKKKLDAMICFLHGIAHNLITISGYDWPSTDYLIEAAIGGVLNE